MYQVHHSDSNGFPGAATDTKPQQYLAAAVDMAETLKKNTGRNYVVVETKIVHTTTTLGEILNDRIRTAE